jgi:hypothetical protein
MTVALVAVVGCGGGAASPSPAATPRAPGDRAHSVLAEDERYRPSYGKAELAAALTTERATVAVGERQVGELEARSSAGDDRVRAAKADLAVRRRFVGALEACDADGRWCPPRLDDPPWTYELETAPAVDPPMTATLRYDLASWRVLADELHGRACACRTIACVDSVSFAIDTLEQRPVAVVRGDEVASGSLTWGRECLFRLRGKAVVRPIRSAAD